MHTTIEAIIEPNGDIRALEPVQLDRRTRALITILENEVGDSGQINDNEGVPTSTGAGYLGLIASLAQFPDDFMADGRQQPVMQEREEL